MAASGNYTSVLNTQISQISAANTNRDGTGTLVDVFTPGASGSRVERITIKATGTTTAGLVRLFLYDGTNTRLWEEVSVSAVTPSATLAAFRAALQNLALLMPNNTWRLRAATEKAETFNIIVEGGNF